MKTLILKLGATGDVVRTTSLCHALHGQITWLTTEKNAQILPRLEGLSVVPWSSRHNVVDDHSYDLVICLEDDLEVAAFASQVASSKHFGSRLSSNGNLEYSPDSASWFDLSVISKHGREVADMLKYENRLSYQEHIFTGLGFTFTGQQYILPKTETPTGLRGDVGIAPKAGPVWPMKGWAYYEQLANDLRSAGYTVNFLPERANLLDHLVDVQGHDCIVCGDSLPMHLALGSGIPCVALFNCTSPWEIYGYGLLRKIVSPDLAQHFYKRTFVPNALASIPLEQVYSATIDQLHSFSQRR